MSFNFYKILKRTINILKMSTTVSKKYTDTRDPIHNAIKSS